MKANQSGRSMIEMLGVLAIIGVLTAGGIAGYAKAMEKYRVNKTTSQISNIAQNLRVLYHAQPDYGDLDSEVSWAAIDRSHALPEEMGSQGTYKNPFAGPVTAKPADRYSKDDHLAFVLTYGGVPRSACIALAATDWGYGHDKGLSVMSINTNIDTVYEGSCTSTSSAASGRNKGYAVACGSSGIMTPVQASAACAAGSDNTIRFKMF